MPKSYINVQKKCNDEYFLPNQSQFEQWCYLALEGIIADINIRLVDLTESQYLNQTYRQKNKSTNVLSFSFEPPKGIETQFLGDIVICPAIVLQEAQAQQKPIDHHWAHMVIHGLLHLRGFDHIAVHEALEMEAKEIHLLIQLNIPNPYLRGDTYE